MAINDDILTAPVPEPDAEPTAAERAHAKAFAELVDKTLVSGRMPPAMSADDRALLEVATVIRAASGGLELAATRQRSVVEDALRQAVGGIASTSLSTTPITSARGRRWVPWLIAGTSTAVAAAAVMTLWLRAPVTVHTTTIKAELPMSWRSRPTDPLIGRISSECGGRGAVECAREATVRTSSRIDQIFADRLEGYRERRLSRGGKP